MLYSLPLFVTHAVIYMNEVDELKCSYVELICSIVYILKLQIGAALISIIW